MINYSPHLSLGDATSEYNILSGIYDKHNVDAVLDVSPSSHANKWHKDKNVVLKKSSIKTDVISKAKLKTIFEFISSNHKQHKHVMLASNKGYLYPCYILFAFLVLKKKMSVEDSLNAINQLVKDFSVDDSFLQSVIRFKESDF